MHETDADHVAITTLEQLSAAEAGQVLGLADAAAAADGVGPLSEQVRLYLEYGGDHAAKDLLLRHGETLAGYSHLGGPDPAGQRSGELVIHPAHRRRGLGLALARAAVAAAGPLPVRIWAHGDLPAAAALAAAAGFTRVRSLLQMRRSLAEPLPEPRLPDGITLRNFVPGRDEDEWLAVNAAAFADHPEQGGWTRDELEHREAQPWFDPACFSPSGAAAWPASTGPRSTRRPARAGQQGQTSRPTWVSRWVRCTWSACIPRSRAPD